MTDFFPFDMPFQNLRMGFSNCKKILTAIKTTISEVFAVSSDRNTSRFNLADVEWSWTNFVNGPYTFPKD